MPLDKFGLPFLYPTAKTAGVSGSGTPFFWQQANDITNDQYVGGSTDLISNINTTTGEFQMNYAGSDSWTIRKDPSFDNTNSIGGCGMDFTATENRGYGWKADQPRNVELKMLLKVINDGDDAGLSIGGPTGRHSDSGCCSGFGYMFNTFLQSNPVKFRFRKEMYHVNYDDDPKTGQWTHPSANFNLVNINRFIGLAYCRYNKKDGRGAGKDSVIVEAWINPDPATNINNWIMMKRTEDDGGWGDGGDSCNGSSSQVGTWSNGQFRIKSVDGVVIKFKNASLREIDPTLSFDDDPNIPPEPPSSGTTTLHGTYKVMWDVNTVRTSSACAGTGGGGGGGSAIFYTIPTSSDKELSNVAASPFNNRTAVGEYAVNSSSILVGKIIKQADVPLKKVGTPGATPTIKVKIFSGAGALIYTSPTEIDPTTLTTSFVKKTFDLSTNTRVMVSGDAIEVEYTGTSSSNYIMSSYNSDTVPNTANFNWEGAFDAKPTREWAADLWE